jgi:aminopeptidase YwaD
MTLEELVFFIRGRLNVASAGLLNTFRGRRPARGGPPSISSDPSPLDIVRALEGRSNREREAAVEGILRAAGLPFSRHPFSTFEGRGVNFAVELGQGKDLVIVIGHHDAVPGSPGANDNAAAVGILVQLARRLLADPPRGIRLRILFTGSEELCYLGARCYAREADLAGARGALSLELCGIGDQFAVWDVEPPFDESPFFRAIARAFEGLGYRRDETYHPVGRIPVFGSDHRAFAALGIPAFGLTVAPGREADRLRAFVLKPLRAALHQVVERPPPFHTYHTSRDSSETLEPAAMERTLQVLLALAKVQA